MINCIHHNNGLFCSQAVISFTCLGFSMYMLIKGNDPGIYLPIITAIIGVWIPSPLSLYKSANKNDVESGSITNEVASNVRTTN